MKLVTYTIHFPKKSKVDWRLHAMQRLESTVLYYCQFPGLEKKKGIDFDDIAQELRLHLWIKLETWNKRLCKVVHFIQFLNRLF